MSIIGLTSVKGAPGVTTTCLALTLAWPRPVLMVEADPAGGDLLAGYLAGAEPPGSGLLGLALAARRGPLGSADVLDRSIALDRDGEYRVLAAPVDPGQWRPIIEAADRIADTLVTSTEHAMDVIVDLGRLGPAAGGPWTGRLSRLLLVVEPTLRGASAARSALGWLPGQLGESCALEVLLAGRGPYGPGEIADAVGVDVGGTIVRDPVSARVLAGETPARRAFDRRPLPRCARALAATLVGPSPSDREPPPPVLADRNGAADARQPDVVGAGGPA